MVLRLLEFNSGTALDATTNANHGYYAAGHNIATIIPLLTPHYPSNVCATMGSYTDKICVTWSSVARSTGYQFAQYDEQLKSASQIK